MAALELINTTLINKPPISYWRMEGNSNDNQGNNNGTDTSITYSTGNGKFGQGAGFNGTTSRIAIAENSDLNVTTAFTILLWEKTSTTGDICMWNNFATFNGGANRYGALVRLSGASGNQVDILLGSGGAQSEITGVSTALADGNWHMVVFVYASTTSHIIYVDGSQDKNDTSSISVSYNTGNMHPGFGFFNNVGSNIDLWPGAIDDSAFFNSALSATEISNHWNGTDGLSSSSVSGFITLLGVGQI